VTAADPLASPAVDTTPDTVDGVALARLYGEPLFQLPQDLYIPPEALEVFLEAFQGPLDLLLYLIRKQNFNILDIPMAEVTRQYLEYVEQIRERNLELAGEYLLMAAMLIEIKSRMLLPARKTEDDGEAEDPRAELVRRLLEYEQIKLAARRLDQLPLLGRDFHRAQAALDDRTERPLPRVELMELRKVWAEILQRAKLNAHHTITRETLSVRDHMTRILRKLQGVRYLEFQRFFDDVLDAHGSVPVVVVHFLAMLELARESLVDIVQAEPYAPIYVRLGYSAAP
jgi:segregation and condensation protein A